MPHEHEAGPKEESPRFVVVVFVKEQPMCGNLHCIRCDRELQSFAEVGAPHQPNGGIACSSFGNYGSTVFDSITGHEELLFVLCDDCLRERKDRVLVAISGEPELAPGAEYFR